MRKVTIIGDGQMGLVGAAIVASDSRSLAGDLDITLWGHSAKDLASLESTRTSSRIKGFVLPRKVHVVADDAAACEGADLLVCAVPTQHIRGVFERLRPHTASGAGVVSFSKGVENDTLLRPTQILADALDGSPDSSRRPLGVLSGPTIAAELARCLPATMVAASDDHDFAETLQALFTTNWLRIYTHGDALGVELAGATKNVIAIAAGVVDGLAAGYNAKSALLARGLAEITRLGLAMGAQRETFFGVAGVGDLATTCFSPEGRNRSCGEALGRGEKLEDYLARTDSVVEGVATTKSVVGLAERHGVDMPLTAAVHAVLFEGQDPLDAIAGLMAREPKRERVG